MVLARSVAMTDPYLRGHTRRVAELAVQMGREMGLDAAALQTLRRSALLHDIGKIGVPETILNKPGRLTDAEFAVVKEHPMRGWAMVKHMRSLQHALGGIRSHHERLDGSGYPDGLIGEAIPLDARIIAVADVYDALTSHRPYRAAWTPERALALIESESGSKLDATCVRALHAALQHLPAPVARYAEEPALAAVS